MWGNGRRSKFHLLFITVCISLSNANANGHPQQIHSLASYSTGNSFAFTKKALGSNYRFARPQSISGLNGLQTYSKFLTVPFHSSPPTSQIVSRIAPSTVQINSQNFPSVIPPFTPFPAPENSSPSTPSKNEKVNDSANLNLNQYFVRENENLSKNEVTDNVLDNIQNLSEDLELLRLIQKINSHGGRKLDNNELSINLAKITPLAELQQQLGQLENRQDSSRVGVEQPVTFFSPSSQQPPQLENLSQGQIPQHIVSSGPSGRFTIPSQTLTGPSQTPFQFPTRFQSFFPPSSNAAEPQQIQPQSVQQQLPQQSPPQFQMDFPLSHQEQTFPQPQLAQTTLPHQSPPQFDPPQQFQMVFPENSPPQSFPQMQVNQQLPVEYSPQPPQIPFQSEFPQQTSPQIQQLPLQNPHQQIQPQFQFDSPPQPVQHMQPISQPPHQNPPPPQFQFPLGRAFGNNRFTLPPPPPGHHHPQTLNQPQENAPHFPPPPPQPHFPQNGFQNNPPHGPPPPEPENGFNPYHLTENFPEPPYESEFARELPLSRDQNEASSNERRFRMEDTAAPAPLDFAQSTLRNVRTEELLDVVQRKPVPPECAYNTISYGLNGEDCVERTKRRAQLEAAKEGS